MDSALLLLADSRLPSGAHAHSGGLEPAVTAGTVTGLAGLEAFLAGRLATTGLVTAALAAAACRIAAGGTAGWAELDAEADARTPSLAQRTASRAQGRGLVRVARTAWPAPLFGDPVLVRRDGPHHPVALGACVHVAGGGAYDAASLAATAAVTGSATAAVRLLGLDPIGVQAILAGLAPAIDATAAAAADADELPATSAPLLDILAEHHLTQEVRLFES